jgi:hypothetical protein
MVTVGSAASQARKNYESQGITRGHFNPCRPPCHGDKKTDISRHTGRDLVSPTIFPFASREICKQILIRTVSSKYDEADERRRLNVRLS